MILLVPVVVATLARLGRRLPLVARYAVRDAARHRTRTVPAVAAVAATVAGVVALGIANASDAAESEGTYLPQLARGMGALTVFDDDIDWDRYTDVVRREAPSVGVTRGAGLRRERRRLLRGSPAQASGRRRAARCSSRPPSRRSAA